MNPVGREEDSFISYLGYLARSKVRIVYSAWKFVDDKTKDLIWTQILQTFDVPNTKAMRKHWMGEKAGTKDDGGRDAANEGSFPIRTFHCYPGPQAHSRRYTADILSTAIGKPDYPDAVRGETRGVSVAKIFGRCSHVDDTCDG
ncbi:hypothetical protein K1719_005718 [Acacia pycnantha]|nr:hypothetical protein K1719_005718 [Acacia pycnantha]